ncbi:hypothetical protein ADUPG1_011061, partial [Aduncisulcus paluster]
EKVPTSRVKKVVGGITLKEARELAARDQEEYEVESILDCKKDEEGDWKFQVKWSGWPKEDASWEYPETLKGLDEFSLFLESHPELKVDVERYLSDRK